MKLPEHFIEEIAKEILGQDTIPLILAFKDKENVSEFKLAEKLNITINQVRNVLYRLHEHNLVSSTRKKDKKKGWYIYFWTFDNNRAKNLLTEHKQKKIDHLRRMLAEQQQTTFYICPNSCIRLDTTTAMEHEFKCIECATLLKEENKEKKMHQFHEQISRYTQEIEDLSQVVSAKEITKSKPKLQKNKISAKHHQKKKHIGSHKNTKKNLPPQKNIHRKTPIEIKEKHISLIKRVKNRFFRI